MSIEWLLLLLPIAYAHGWFTGRGFGIKIGAAGMFDQLYSKGEPTSKSGVRLIEVSLDDEQESVELIQTRIRRKENVGTAISLPVQFNWRYT